MRIEVLVGSEEPLIFPLNSPKFSLGSGENCEVILSASGISRKHLIITTEDDKYYVTDQGSTNGSFINEERLIPGKKIEFTSFFPVRLGDNVLVSLLSDEEDVGEPFSSPVSSEKSSPNLKMAERSDATTVINLNDLRKVKTESLVLERNQKREIRKKTSQVKKEPVKVKKKVNYVGWFAAFIVVAAAYYNFYMLENAEDKEAVRQVGKIIQATPSDVSPVANPPVVSPETSSVQKNDLVDPSDLPTKEFVTKLLTDPKCIIDVELSICRMFAGKIGGQFGAVQVGLTVYLLIDGTTYFEQAQKFIPEQEEQELLRKTTSYLFFTHHVPEMDLPALGEIRVIVAFFKFTKDGPVADTIVAVKPEVWNRNKSNFNHKQLKNIMSIGVNAISYAEAFYTVY